MAIIKHNNAGRIISDALVLDLSDLHRQADDILDRARTEAQQILEQGRREAQKLVDAADSRGHAEGYERGMAEGHAAGLQQAEAQFMETTQPQLEELADSWRTALTDWEARRAEMLMQAGTDVLVFAFELAQRVIHRAVTFDGSIVRTQLAEALSLIAEPTALVIEINPDDRPFVEQILPTLLERAGTAQHATVRDEETIERGGCRVRTAGGSIDATIGRQLERLAEALLPESRVIAPDRPSDDGVSDEQVGAS